uniref:HTH La-type RNA-binding domain-containing protein n=1 Tax=Cuerna arida TaxID=1464854 RepID=A0A1B6G0Z5_9HEMI
MADVNGSTEETSVKETQESETKVDVNGGGDNTGEQVAEEKIELDPEQRAKKIKRQIEYYFGDYNLPTDKFLREQVKLKDGWVPLETLLKFKRLASLTQDPQVIVEALTGSEIIQINEEKTELRRNPDKPLPEESEARRKEILKRSVYVKGFPQEGFTIDNALDFFEEYGPTDDVVMRFYQDKATKTWHFKGSVFIKYPTKDAAAAFLALEEVKYKDTPLVRLWQEDYIEQKRKERLDQKLQNRKRPERHDEAANQDEDRGLPKDATLHMTKCPEGLTREQVKEKIESLGVTVAFIDFNKGDDEGWIRLHEAGTAATVIKECDDGVLKISDDVQVEVRALEGDEEAKFLQTAKQNINARRAKGNRGRRGGRGGRGGGGGNWRKRKHDNSGEPQAKAMKKGRGDSGDEGD